MLCNWSDVWSAGVTLFQWIYGTLPFMADAAPQLFEVICQQPLAFPYAHPNQSLTELLTALLEKTPEARISLHALCHHPWVTAEEPLILSKDTISTHV